MEALYILKWVNYMACELNRALTKKMKKNSMNCYVDIFMLYH